MKERRAHIRIPLLQGSLYVTSSAHPGRALNVRDISNNGLFIESDDLPVPETLVKIGVELPGELGMIEIDAVVTRIVWAVKKKDNSTKKGFGVQIFCSSNIQKIWEAFVVFQRNKQIISVSKRIIEEFFGSKGPNT